MNFPSKRGLAMVMFIMIASYCYAQVSSANNGLNTTGSDPNKVVGLGGTLADAQTAIDFNSSNSNSSFLLKKGTSNYFYVGNNGNIGIGNNSPAQKLDVTGMIQSSTGFKYGSTIGANLETYGTYTRLVSNNTTDGLMFWADKNPSSIKFLINGAGRGLMLDGTTTDLLFMDGSGNNLGGIGSVNGTGHLALLYSTAINSHTEGARLTNTGNFGIGTTSPAANLHVIQKSASQAGMIIKSHTDAQTANTFEVQDAAGNPVLKVRGTQNGTYAQAAVAIDQGNKTNNLGLAISNIGPGLSAMGFGGSDGGSLMLTDFDLHHSPTWTYTNKHAKWRVINNALDGPSVESYSFEHYDQPATMNLMTLKGQTSQTGDMLRIKDGAGTDIFRVKATGGGYFADKVGIGILNPVFKLDMDSPGNDGGNGDTRFRIANTTSTGTNDAGSRPTIEVLGARGDGNGTFEGKLALGTRRTDGNALSNQTLGAILFGGQHGTDQTFQSSKILYPASIQGLAEGTFSNATAMPTGIAFFTSSTGNAAGSSNLSYGTERMRIGSNGSVGIGTTNIADNGYKLFVEMGIRTRKVKVDLAQWSDFVFEQDYDLPTISEVEQFIQKNKHLPGVPSAKEVEQNGLDLGQTQALLLQKIEELTLYVIEQSKRNELQEKRISELEAELKTIKKKSAK